MRDYKAELETRVEFIKNVIKDAGAKGIVFGNSGGKDCALVGILCAKATDNVLSVMMPCSSKQNYGSDMTDAIALCDRFGIENATVRLDDAKKEILGGALLVQEISDAAQANIAPRLRMTTLYAIAQSRSALVAGTGNRSEAYMGYFTKWGDGGYDFNPISDLTVTEIYEFLAYLGAPSNIITKAPSAGLFDGQTDEKEMGITYKDIDKYIFGGEISTKVAAKIEKAHNASAHKRKMPTVFKENN